MKQHHHLQRKDERKLTEWQTIRTPADIHDRPVVFETLMVGESK